MTFKGQSKKELLPCISDPDNGRENGCKFGSGTIFLIAKSAQRKAGGDVQRQ